MFHSTQNTAAVGTPRHLNSSGEPSRGVLLLALPHERNRSPVTRDRSPNSEQADAVMSVPSGCGGAIPSGASCCGGESCPVPSTPPYANLCGHARENGAEAARPFVVPARATHSRSNRPAPHVLHFASRAGSMPAGAKWCGASCFHQGSRNGFPHSARRLPGPGASRLFAFWMERSQRHD